MDYPVLVPLRDGTPRPRVVHLLPSSPPLVPLLAADGEITPDVDRILTMLAHEAQSGDVAARNALYTACEPKIARFARRYRSVFGVTHRCPAFDFDDVVQEAFLVFVDLVDDWPGGDSFGAYFLGHFPWQLRNALRRIAAANRTSSDFGASAVLSILTDGSSAASEATALLRAIAARLPEPDGAILLCRILDGESYGAIARRLGTSRRTVARAWARITADLRRSMAR
jgi:RNA polymerase sigma factor (sigma-70 family)